MSRDRERGVTLRLLDPDALRKQALGHLKVMAPTVKWVEALTDQAYAMAEVGEDVYVVCREGVGWKVDYDKPLNLNVVASWRDDDGKVVGSLTPTTRVHLSRYEIVELAKVSTGTIDLADLVREFGSRLENNFWLWHMTLTGART